MSTQTEPAAAAHADEVAEISYRDAVNAALVDELASDPAVYFMGEDVGTAGGVFKTSEGIADAFPGRVINTPICENGFLGVALGMAVTGLRPVVEIMFSDFLPTGADALVNEIPKFRYMSGGQCEVPLTIRSIGGATGRFGTQHSATGESWFLQHPGLYVCTAGTPGAAYSVLRAAIQNRNPVLFFEHKGLYGRKGPVRRGSVAEFGKAEVVREGADATILTTLLMTERSLAAARQLADEGVDVEVIDMLAPPAGPRDRPGEPRQDGATHDRRGAGARGELGRNRDLAPDDGGPAVGAAPAGAERVRRAADSLQPAARGRVDPRR
jgi:pyruvate/2-oxoglutarate/acetoin dehydrogenase E1 component